MGKNGKMATTCSEAYQSGVPGNRAPPFAYIECMLADFAGGRNQNKLAYFAN